MRSKPNRKHVTQTNNQGEAIPILRVKKGASRRQIYAAAPSIYSG